MQKTIRAVAKITEEEYGHAKNNKSSGQKNRGTRRMG